MATTIQIKRSTGTSAPSSLSAGELAVTFGTGTQSNLGDRLFIGDGSNVDVIGGKFFSDMLDHTQGTLTASSALTVDSNKAVDDLIVGNNATTGGSIELKEGTNNGTHHVQLKAPNALGADLALTLPGSDGNSGEVLKTNGSGTLSFGTLALSDATGTLALSALEIDGGTDIGADLADADLIIVDDASPDDTFDYIQKIAESDDRIIPFRLEKNGGTYVAKNHGMLHAKGKYLAFHDSDDWAHRDKLRLQIEKLESREDLIGTTTGYIRVDENSNIIYRGKGSIRHACISLMINREKVISRIGYFDSVRVSADSEYERRIHAVFGKESIEHFDIPLIVASVRTESLSGGGKFALGWTGLSGPRLEYRQKFESYHDQVRNGKESGFVDFPLEVRTFDAPKDMIW